MRISASGLASTIEVAIDQILRLAPSISGPIEPVVSSTKPTSTTGLAAAWPDPTNGRSKNARANALASLASMTSPLKMILRRHQEFRAFAAGAGRDCGRPSADWRRDALPQAAPESD